MPGFELIDRKEYLAVKKIFDDGGVLFAHGFESLRKNYHVREFENNFKRYTRAKYCLAVSSGTAAIKIGLKSLGVKSGDEVITQTFNFIATVEAIVDIGAVPVIVNIDKSLNIDIEDLKKKISKKTKVVIPVHMLGYPCDMKKLMKICKQKKIKILEDNCESLGGMFQKKLLGNCADIGVVSFDFGKTITTGEGGMIITNNKKIYNYCKEYHDHGHKNLKNVNRGEDSFSSPGFNFRMTELQGAIGKSQLKKISKLLKDNKKKYNILKNNLSNFEKRKLVKDGIPNYDTFIFFAKNSAQKKKILNVIEKEQFSTKNLPDAIKWHCASYWTHILSAKEIEKIKISLKILKKAIALPIFYKKSEKFYTNLANEINEVF
jgi:8-amino-3,8-dideoxy-alpha-D-manno-octulosonate transaminase